MVALQFLHRTEIASNRNMLNTPVLPELVCLLQ